MHCKQRRCVRLHQLLGVGNLPCYPLIAISKVRDAFSFIELVN